MSPQFAGYKVEGRNFKKILYIVVIAVVILTCLVVAFTVAFSQANKKSPICDQERDIIQEPSSASPCSREPCQNQATCFELPDGEYICKCRSNNYGNGCEYSVLSNVVANETAQNACTSTPCANGGTCANVLPTNYVCSCKVPFFGKNCLNSKFLDNRNFDHKILKSNYGIHALSPNLK